MYAATDTPPKGYPPFLPGLAVSVAGTELEALPAPPVNIATFEKEGMERTLLSGGPGAMLIQKGKRG